MEYKYNCYEQDLLDNNHQVKGRVAVLFGGMNSANPKAYMDNAVYDYLHKQGDSLHNQFVEIHMDNPWTRVIVTGINDLPYREETIIY